MSPFFKNANDLQIFYDDINPRYEKTVMFLHGWGSTCSFFNEQVPLFSNHEYRILMFDAEGHGKSERARLTGDLNHYHTLYRDAIIQDIFQLFRIRDVGGPLGILGHSLVGGGIAQLIAMQYPDMVDFLILLNTGPILLDNPVSNIFWNVLPKFVRMNYQAFFDFEQLDEMLQRTLPYIRLAIKEELNRANAHDPGYVPPSTRQVDEIIVEEIFSLVQDPLQPEAIACPTLIVGFELDNFAPVQMSRQLSREIPGAEYHEIAMGGHFGPSHRSQEVNEIIASFLAKNDLA